MSVSVVLFTSDLRLHDHPPLRVALASADEVVPLFVLDDGIGRAGFAVPNRRAFLADCLRDLDAGLRDRGGRLVVRSGEVTAEVCRIVDGTGADAVHMSAGVSGYAQRREERLREALGGRGCRLHVHDTVITAVAPGEVTPSGPGRDHFAVFTPYLRRWSGVRLRAPFAAPRAVRVPPEPASASLPVRSDVAGVSPGLAEGGERAGRARFAAWRRQGLGAYEARHDDLAGDVTSRLSPHLHFGTISSTELVRRAREAGGPGAEAFVRQLCWRDFHHQVLAARPQAAHRDYRSQGDRWRGERSAQEEIDAWKEGRTGYPLVDAALRQLRHEGWMHNRGRLVTASFLVKTLYVDWRVGARHFLDLLVDGDLANNQLNWQWMAGTGTDSRPNRVLNPLLQARRYDPEGVYVRRWVPELAGIGGAAVHEPWKLRAAGRCDGYPEPLVELGEGLARFKHARGLD
ncbi:deoxyribodipyrimidine photo-lyase [Streptomyces sp. B1I3]|uniref:cryptochrome/photolyase family protein n=1 Tax=Streptomyces sp. B1I3 TaxID=3042264 RepID=UPI00277D3157|nr:deoxyribodipyrimidine photo-lyase [Streptomyces sp. B1I3]MDQ0792577.1 deoxyribodipyrimidine photo-lyase [Streptomyces sp. B1I3]